MSTRGVPRGSKLSLPVGLGQLLEGSVNWNSGRHVVAVCQNEFLNARHNLIVCCCSRTDVQTQHARYHSSQVHQLTQNTHQLEITDNEHFINIIQFHQGSKLRIWEVWGGGGRWGGRHGAMGDKWGSGRLIA